MNDIPALNPNASPNQPISSWITAPPIIAVQRIPAKEPWLLSTEFNAKENITDHITESENPTNGKVIKAILPVVNNEAVKNITADITAPVKIFRLSNNFNRMSPIRQPMDIIPQNHPTTGAPTFIGS